MIVFVVFMKIFILFILPRLYNGNPVGQQFGPKCARGDRIGCGIHSENIEAGFTSVFFTKNGKEVGVFFNVNDLQTQTCTVTTSGLRELEYVSLSYVPLPCRLVQWRFLCLQRGCSLP